MAAPVGFTLKCSAKDLDRKDGPMGKSDPYFVIKAVNPQTRAQQEVFKSEVIEKDLTPRWNNFDIEYDTVGGAGATITVQVFDWDKDGTHDLIGEFTTTLSAMARSGFSEKLINPHKRGRAFYKNSGTFYVDHVTPLTQKKQQATAYTLTLECKDLDRKDGLGKSDPFLVIRATPVKWYSQPGNPYLNTPPAQNPRKVGKAKKANKVPKEGKTAIYKSEVIQNNLNPRWAPFRVDVAAFGSLAAPVFIDVYDADEDGTHDLIGTAQSNLLSLVSPGCKIPLINVYKQGRVGYRNSGTLHLVNATPHYEQPQPPLGAFRMTVRADKVDKKDLGGLGASDPFLLFKAAPYSSATFQKVHQTEHLQNTTTPQWKEFVLNIADCGGMDKEIQVECYDYDVHSKHDLIGEFSTTLRELTLNALGGRPAFRLYNKKKSEMRGALYRNSGLVRVLSCAPCASVATAHSAAAAAPGAHGVAAAAAAVPAQHGQPGAYPQQAYPGYPPQGQPGYPPAAYPQGAPQGYPPQQGGYPPQGYPQQYPPQGYPPQAYAQQAPPQGYPPQAYPGYPPQPQGYPPQQYPPQGYPPQQQPYYPPPPQQGGYPPQQGGYPPQQPQQPGYPPQQPGYPPQG